ncbi:hypothetical protein B0H12DRAFT_1136108 [Mycena haematopus]|nr:hypothetical protein B0H12DRAFT_1136108 [Mycena haematopus]
MSIPCTRLFGSPALPCGRPVWSPIILLENSLSNQLRSISSQDSENIPTQPPRPPNAFLCFRSQFLQDKKAASHTEPEGSTSSLMSDLNPVQRWHSMSVEERRPHVHMALRLQQEHQISYPNSKFALGKGKKSAVPLPGPILRRGCPTKGPGNRRLSHHFLPDRPKPGATYSQLSFYSWPPCLVSNNFETL